MPRRERKRIVPNQYNIKPKPRRSKTRTTKPNNRNIRSGKVKEISTNEYILQKFKGNTLSNTIRNKDKYLHVSDLLTKCMRAFAISHTTGTELIGEAIYDNLGVTFAIGSAIGDYVVRRAETIAPSAVYGIWKCSCGKTKHTGTKKEAEDKGKCEKCDTKLDRFNEFVVANDDIMVSGSVDLCLLISNHFYLTEVKSIKKEDWDALTRPLPIHILQIVFYWWLMKEAGYSLYSQVSILYTSKAHTRGSPFKEFCIDPRDHLHRLDDYIEDAKALKEAKKGGELPVRICGNENTSMAKKCSVCFLCFEL